MNALIHCFSLKKLILTITLVDGIVRRPSYTNVVMKARKTFLTIPWSSNPNSGILLEPLMNDDI